MVAGLVWLVACGGAAALVIVSDAPSIARYVGGAGALGYFVAMIVAMIPQQVTLAVAAGEIVPSWRAEVRGAPELGSWVAAGIDAPMGSCCASGPSASAAMATTARATTFV